MTDPIADIITRIRNAYMAKKQTCLVPHSNIKQSLAETLKAEGFLDAVEVSGDSKKTITITLKYVNKEPSISRIERISKPGRRQYRGVKNVNSPLSGYGINILSTSKGIMTDKAARKANLGGEILCRVY